MTRRSGPPLVALAALFLGAPAGLPAQFRPLDPVAWTVFGSGNASLVVGSGLLLDQRASLAGTEGHLWEIGSFNLVWRVGRAALGFSGTALWIYRDDEVFAPPYGGARPADGRLRKDAGDYRVSTTVLLTPPSPTDALALRFGTRLPTTSNQEGLGRDATDFFFTLVGWQRRGRWQASGEVGLGIIGTRDPENEQVDPVLFAGRGEWDLGRVTPFLEVTGQHDTRSGPEPRGTENHGEGRLGVRIGHERWLSAAVIRGWTRVGPEVGFRVVVGALF